MPSYCAVGNCPNHSGNIDPSEIFFHRFPNEKNRLNCLRWVSLCQRGGRKINTKSSVICSKHFLETDYERDYQGEFEGAIRKKRRLRPDAEPSLYLPRVSTPISESAKRRTERAKVKARKELVDEILKNHDKEAEMKKAEATSTMESTPSTFEAATQTNKYMERLERRLNQAERRIRQQQKRIQKLNTSNHYLKKRLQTQLKKQLAPAKTSGIFSKSQLKKLRGKRVRWSTEDIIRALSVRSISLKAYETAQKVWKLPLPTARTLRNWASNFTCSPGIIEDVLIIMKEQSEKMHFREKVCALSFDEMSISSLNVYDKTADAIKSNSKAQVVMARGICSNWKQPIFFNFDTDMTKDLLMEIIKSLEEAGFPVLSVTSDLGAENRSLWKSLNITTENVSFKNPSANRNVYVFADIPHMLKLIRSHILDGIRLSDKSKTIIEKSTFEKLISYDNSEVKLCPRLNQKLIELNNSERMRVRPAAQLLSNSVAKLAKRVFKSKPVIAKIIQLINDGFDILNSRVPLDKCPLKSGLGNNYELQKKILNELLSFLQSATFMRYTKDGSRVPKSPLPCQKGFIISIKSTLGLYEEMKSLLPDFKYLLTSRLNQDCLESLFSRIRAYGGSSLNPTPVEFRYRLRLILLGSKIRAPKGTNVEFDEDLSFMSAKLIEKNRLLNRQVNSTENDSDYQRPFSQRILRAHRTSDYVHEDAVQYLSGFVAWSLKKKKIDVYGTETPHSSKTWISSLSRGKLITPTAEFHSWVMKCNGIFLKCTQTDNYSPNLSKNVSEQIRSLYPEIPSHVIKEFIKVRVMIRTNHLNSTNFTQSSRRQKLKAKQFVKSSRRK